MLLDLVGDVVTSDPAGGTRAGRHTDGHHWNLGPEPSTACRTPAAAPGPRPDRAGLTNRRILLRLERPRATVAFVERIARELREALGAANRTACVDLGRRHGLPAPPDAGPGRCRARRDAPGRRRHDHGPRGAGRAPAPEHDRVVDVATARPLARPRPAPPALARAPAPRLGRHPVRRPSLPVRCPGARVSA
ncbi:hypothetical protein KPATCC21470_0036 [Kitasatospora purpeofusca]